MKSMRRAMRAVCVATAFLIAGSATAQDRSKHQQVPLSVEGQRASDGNEVAELPRLWTLVPGLILFAPSYGLAAYEGVIGDPGAYGSHRPGEDAPYHFGTKQLLLIPVLGPVLFESSFCSDARAYYGDHPSSDEPQDACSGSSLFWAWTGVQAVGASLIAASYLPESGSSAPVSSSHDAPEVLQISVTRTSQGTAVWQVAGAF